MAVIIMTNIVTTPMGVKIDKRFQRSISATLLERSEAIQKHKQFGRMCEMFITRLLENHEEFRFLSKLVSTSTGLWIGLYFSYLDITKSEANCPQPTLSQLQVFNAEHRLMSPNASSALVMLAEFLGYVRKVKSEADARAKIIESTELFNSITRKYLLMHFVPHVVLKDENFDIQVLLHSKIYLDLLLINTARRIDVAVAYNRYLPDMDYFYTKTSGLDVIVMLTMDVLTGRREDRAVEVSYSYLSSRLHVSRNHVKNIIQSAQERNLLTIVDGSKKKLILHDSLINTLKLFFSIKFSFQTEIAQSSFEEYRSLQK